tara:strand:+ start:7 stop:168 length:162 start_codon:yes stop_codon:yes gene_type:complete
MKIQNLSPMRVITLAVVAGAASSAFEHYYRKMAKDGQFQISFLNDLFGIKEGS